MADNNVEKFAVSDDFARFEANNATAIEAVREAEVRAMGIGLPLGTMGSCTIIAATAKASKQYTDDKGVVKGGNPMVSMTFEVVTPEEKKGHKFYRNFIFNEHERFSATDKYAQWLDFMEKAGLPREVRAVSTAAIINWCKDAARSFDYEVIADKYGDDKELNVQPRVGVSNALPTPSATSAALQSTGAPSNPPVVGTSNPVVGTGTATSAPTDVVPGTFEPFSMVKFAGSEFMVSDQPSATAGKIRIINPSNQRPMDVDPGQCRPA